MIVGRRVGRPIKAWEEEDLYTRWRHLEFWHRGERRKIKRRTHKRERRYARGEILQEVLESADG